MTRILCAISVVLLTTLPGLAGADELTAIIQKDLTTLGYETGGTDGEMTVQTAVAVSKFQAENGMEVTGEVTPQLAGIIKAAISKQGRAPAAASAAVPATNAAPTQMPAAAGMNPAAMQALMQGQGAAGMDPAALQSLMQMQMMGGAAAGMDPAAIQAMIAAQGGAAVDPATLQAMQAQAPVPATPSAQQACLQQKIAAAQQAQQEQQESAQRRRGFGSLMRGLSRLGGEDVASSIAGVTAEIAETSAAIGDLESAARDLGLTEDEVASCQTAQ